MNESSQSMKVWLEDITSKTIRYLEQNTQEKTLVVKYSPPFDLREMANFSVGKAESYENLGQLIDLILDKSVRTTHPMFLNQLFGGVTEEALSAEWLTALLNPTMATFEIAPVMTILEKEVARKLCNLFGLKLGEGIMVTGGSNANLVGLLCARQFKVPDIKKRGYQSKKYTIYVSEEAHYSYEKAFDPITEINKVAREYNLWLHVDAAWGGGAIFSSKHKHLLKGIHLADSLTFDAHKTLNSGLISSFVLCKHPGMLKQTNQGGGSEYLFHDYDNSDWDTGTYSLQCGRRADILKLWLLWKSRGDKGLELMINHLFELSEYIKQKILSNPRLKLISSQYLNNCFQVLPLNELTDRNEFTLNVRTHLVRKGVALINYVERPDRTTFFRVVTANNQTQFSDIDRMFEELQRSMEYLDSL